MLNFYDQEQNLISNESQSMIDEPENKLYDAIISKIIDDPRIDKKTLIKKFIAKLEMESNISGQMMSELSQIKNMMIGDSESQIQISMDNPDKDLN